MGCSFPWARSPRLFQVSLHLIHTNSRIKDLLLCNLLSLDAIVHLCYTLLAVTHYLLFPAGSDLSAPSDQQMHSFKNADPGYSEHRSKRTMAFVGTLSAPLRSELVLFVCVILCCAVISYFKAEM